MSNDSNWIPVTRKVILCETATKLVSSWPCGGGCGEHYAASGLKVYEFSTDDLLVPVSLCGHVYATHTAVGKGGITGTCSSLGLGENRLPFLIQV